MATTIITGVQYSGIWNLSSQASAKGAGTWPYIEPAGSLYAMGINNAGQLGTSNTTYFSSPVQVGALSTWSKLAAASSTSGGIALDGTLWMWGANDFGYLGLGNRTNYSSPKQVGSLTSWSKLSIGAPGATMAIKSDGTLWGWGSSSNGRLGLGNLTYYSSPKQVGSLTNWLSICSANDNCFAIKTDGSLWAWGSNSQGRLGLGNTTSYSSPVQVGALYGWSMVSAQGQTTLAIKTDGTLWSWGRGSLGALGLGNTTYYSSPKQIGALTNWSFVACGLLRGLATKTDGTLWVWGYNNEGALGLGNTTNYSSPKQLGALTSWAKVYGQTNNNYSTLANKTDGTLWSWGNNTYGLLGLNNLTSYSSPVQVGVQTNWGENPNTIAIGANHSLATRV